MNSETGTETCADRVERFGYLARRLVRPLHRSLLNRRRLTLGSAAAAAAAISLPTLAEARNPFEFPTPVTPVAHDTLYVHDLFLAVMAVVFGIGMCVLLYSVIQHRKSRGYSPAAFSGPKTLGQWMVVVVPVLALAFIDYVVMGIPSYYAVVAMANTREDAALVVKATASQWKWRYEYPDQEIAFTSSLSTPRAQIESGSPTDPHYLYEVDNPLVLPAGKKVRILLVSLDVIHSWWVPAFGVKQDAVPGFLRETWVKIEKPGIYRGQCGELCGTGHAFMPIVVVAKAEPAFERWVAQTQNGEKAVALAEEQPLSRNDLLARGKTAYETNCAPCHQITGLGLPGAIPPLAAGQAFTATPELTDKLAQLGTYRDGKIVLVPVDRQLGIVLHGISGTPMPAFGLQLGDADIAAIVTYVRNSFGNHTGDVVQPAAVKSARVQAN